MTSTIAQPRHGFHDATWLTHAVWYLGVLAAAFLIPFVFSSQMNLANDLYYAIYFALAILVLAAYVVTTGVDVQDMFRRGWKLSLVLGVFAAAFVVWNVLTREDSTPRPDGAYFVFTIAWRGVLYGVVDALLLTAFPVWRSPLPASAVRSAV